ncbi:hypothetical protein RJ640_028702 [Escallonia rubra]|uniref:Uncharacterized protein n=1 Tax=Escallonia rubra TaxID=112253 RepID=A0AA88R9V2_9ASTE|nr:hypothetical protein RJ640_028702 [Escallonia rubra]
MGGFTMGGLGTYGGFTMGGFTMGGLGTYGGFTMGGFTMGGLGTYGGLGRYGGFTMGGFGTYGDKVASQWVVLAHREVWADRVASQREVLARGVASRLAVLVHRVALQLEQWVATGKKKHEGSRKQGDSRDHRANGGPREGCLYCAGPHYRRYCPHKGKMIAFLEKHKGNKGNSSNIDGEAHMGALQMVNAFVQKSKA